jgi:hypothetical protein
MWGRTKRLINSYLDELIERASGPDREVREVTRAELARLNELEVQARASVKMLEKELAEVELKMIGVAERERQLRERGDASAASATEELVRLSSHRDMLKQQIGEANSSAERARALREERGRAKHDLVNETHLTTMRENLAGIQAPFGANDPAATLEEMKARLGHAGTPTIEDKIAAAEREHEAERARAQVDELLARYKQGVTRDEARPASAPAEPAKGEDPDKPKTLGRSEGPIRPID